MIISRNTYKYKALKKNIKEYALSSCEYIIKKIFEVSKTKQRIKELFFLIFKQIKAVIIIPSILSIKDKYLPKLISYPKILKYIFNIKLYRIGPASVLQCLLKLSSIDTDGSATQKLIISSNHRWS